MNAELPWSTTPSDIGVVVVSEVRLYREGLEAVLGSEEGLRTLGTAGGRLETTELLRMHRPAVALVDMDTSHSHALVRDLARSFPEVRFIGLAVPDRDDSVLSCAEAGVAGYVRRDGSIADLVHAIQAVVRGEFLCPPRLVSVLARRLASLSSAEGASPSVERLTDREHEILRCMAEGKDNKAIARELSIAVSTVKNHAHNLFEKMGVHSRTEAVEQYRRGSGSMGR